MAKKMGRPTKMTKGVISKLEDAFSMGCSDIEACFHAGISNNTLYNYQKDNPDFLERKKRLKANPVMKARSTIVKDLDSVDTAKWFAERKIKEEFSLRPVVEADVQINLAAIRNLSNEQLLRIVAEGEGDPGATGIGQEESLELRGPELSDLSGGLAPSSDNGEARGD